VSLAELLSRLNELQGSDLHLKPTRPPLARLNGVLVPLGSEALEPATIVEMLDPIIPQRLRPRLAEQMAIEFGYGAGELSRFRVSIYHQRGTRAAVLRRVAFDFPSLDDWGLPPVLAEFCRLPQGLVLICGPTGSGKSSTLAAMMQLITDSRPHHVITIEDPIEFLIADGMASVSQREVGTDTPSFSVALHNALRQDPDVIMVGEMRDEETIGTVLTAAETGHLVFSTLHTNNAVQTVDRIVGTFARSNHEQIRQRLAAVLEAVVSMQLVPRADGSGLVAAVEILRRTPQVSKLVLQGEYERLHEELESCVVYHKMQSMNQSLAALVIHGTVTREAAMSVSWKPDALDLLLRSALGMTDQGRKEGGDMAGCTADFSKIVELQEIKKLYEELQERSSGEIRRRDDEIRELRAEIDGLRGSESTEDGRLQELRAENLRLAGELEHTREEYESKLARLNARLREDAGRGGRATPAEPAAAPVGRKGFFRP
jgi:twitching motility protein PilT